MYGNDCKYAHGREEFKRLLDIAGQEVRLFLIYSMLIFDCGRMKGECVDSLWIRMSFLWTNTCFFKHAFKLSI